MLIGAHGYHDKLYVQLIQEYRVDEDVAQHLAHNYGDRASLVTSLPSSSQRLHASYPYIEAEVRYACRYEYAETLIDVIARRMRLAFVDVRVAQAILPRMVQIMTEEKNWSTSEQQRQLQLVTEYLKTMGSEEVTSAKK